ncbi:TetR/AcrR family transcriptional regulator [Phaeobacter sp. HF9A]|uniref:TetR/AcrR family transcriptional regulator n=1 Tax=Phaeobacter sp. HF9A TaxID=2721561 RepID=UPI00142FB4CD|nr:TetR/AcrR family transcriptional regulator [Phaeobacter sp. HF9A]NIZ12342.1 TetR/AcrR family transcriptional regulator [Phaeobacter sp. HF9A]
MKTNSYHHNDLAKALTRAALDLMEERNGPHFSLRELARIVGVTHPSVYRHFKDKSELLNRLMDQGIDRMRTYQLAEQAEAPDTPLEQLQALCTAYVRFARENAGFFSLLFDSFHHADCDVGSRKRFNSETLGALFSAIERCQEAGILIPGDPGRIAGYLILAPHGLASYTARGLGFDPAVNDRLTLMGVKELAFVGIAPLLCNPPDRSVISELVFGAGSGGLADPDPAEGADQ